MEGYGQTEALAGCTLTIAGDYTTGITLNNAKKLKLKNNLLSVDSLLFIIYQ